MSRDATLHRPKSEGSRNGISSIKCRPLCWSLGFAVVVSVATNMGSAHGQNPQPKSTSPRPIGLPQTPAKNDLPQPDVGLPPPRPLDPPPMGMNKTAPRPQEKLLGQTPSPGPKTAEKFDKYVSGFVDTEATMELISGRTRLLILKHTPKRIQIADDAVAEFTVLTKDQITLIGKAVGVTVITMWFADPNDATKEDIMTFHVRVLPDPEILRRLERVYKTLQDQINCAFPDSVICLHVVGDKLVVTGEAKDIAECAQILKIIRANANPPGGHSGTARIPTDRQKPARDPNNPSEPNGQPLVPGVDDYLLEGASWIVNMIRIPGEQTVNLKVTIAEINRSAARSIGLNFALFNNDGTPYLISNTGLMGVGGPALGFGGGGIGATTTGGSSAPNILAQLDNGQVRLAITALRNLKYAKLMAEPNLATINGQTANFRAGGQFPVPVLSGAGFGNVLQGVSYTPYGIDLNFTPYITDRDRIRLVLNADVTGLDLDTNRVNNNIGGFSVPYLRQRRVDTTVEMREGQTLAVAGLIQNTASGESTRVPFFGDLPVLGNLFGVNRVSAGEQELVILVTPELVHPLDCKDRLPLPGQDLFEPTDCEFYILGRIEGHRQADYRSPIRTDWQRIRQYKQMEATYIAGPTGYCEP